MKKCLLLIIIICACSACGGGSSGGSSGNNSSGGGGTTGTVYLVPGTGLVENSEINNGIVSITFPSAVGDQPKITALNVAGSNGDGRADLSSSSKNSFDITTDAVMVYFPNAGNYVLTVTISDAGDAAQQEIINITVPGSQSYALSGQIKDGPLNSEAGVRTNVRLYWNPLSYANTQIALTQSDDSNNGQYQFSNLVGSASYFRVGVDGGTQ